MDALAKILYNDFFLRDVLGKITPGFLVFFTVLKVINHDFHPLKLLDGGTLDRWVSLVGTVAVSYLVGLALQLGGKLLGVHSPSPYPNHLFFMRVEDNNFLKRRIDGTKLLWIIKVDLDKWAQANRDFVERLKLKRVHADKLKEGVAPQIERFVVLKEASGNLSLALFVAGLLWFVALRPEQSWKVIIFEVLVWLLAIALLYYSHLIHQRRQALFEIEVLAATVTEPEKPKLEAMKERFKRPW